VTTFKQQAIRALADIYRGETQYTDEYLGSVVDMYLAGFRGEHVPDMAYILMTLYGDRSHVEYVAIPPPVWSSVPERIH
jgi:hypothetical protein